MAAFRHLALRTQNIDLARRFYEEGIGLRFLGYRPSGESMDLSDGTVNLTLLPYPGPARAALEEGTEFIHLGLLVDDVATVYQRLLALGAPIVRADVKERRVHEAGQIPVGSFKVLDPDGNVLDISDQPQEWRVE